MVRLGNNTLKPASVTRRASRLRHRSQGFSLLEVLLASVMLLIIALGIVPLFVRSVGLNSEGRLASVSTALASDEIERLMGVPFNGPEMSILPGSTERLVDQYQAEPRGEWVDAGAWGGGGFSFHRIVRVRQFSFGALNGTADAVLDAAEALDGSTLPGLVQMKEIVVQVQSGTFIGGASRAVTLRVLRGV